MRYVVVAVLLGLLFSVSAYAGPDQMECDVINARLSGRGVKVLLRNGEKITGTFLSLSDGNLVLRCKPAEKGSDGMVREIRVSTVTYVEDRGEVWAKVLGAFGGLGVGTIGGFGLALSVGDESGLQYPALFASMAGGAAAGGVIGQLMSRDRFYFGGTDRAPVVLAERTPQVSRPPLYTISGHAGTFGYFDDARFNDIRGGGVGCEFPLTRKLSLVVDFSYSEAPSVLSSDEYRYPDDAGIDHTFRSEYSESLRLYEGDVLVRYAIRKTGRFRPYVEGGYGAGYHAVKRHQVCLLDGVLESEYDDDTGGVIPLQIRGGAGCQISIARGFGIDLRGQVATFWGNSARLSAGLIYGFDQ